MDQFSELVDVNLDTLRKAITDNREVFVSVINKVNDDFHSKHVNVVSDLETIVLEVAESNKALQIVEKKGDENSKEIRKALIEYEAFINSSIFNEKAARSAITMNLATSLDDLSKDSNKRFGQLRAVMESQHATLFTKTVDLENDLGKLDTDHTNLFYELKDYVTANDT
jgi:hypothetical protein